MHILIATAHPMAATGFFEDPVLMIALFFLAVIVWGLVFVVRRDGRLVGKHTQALGAYAREHGYGYEPGTVEGFAEQFPDLALGPRPRVSSVVSHTRGARPFWAFNYSAFTGSAGGSSGSTRASLAMFIMKTDGDVGRMALRPKRLFDRVKGAFGRGDIETGVAEFDRAYHITTSTPEWGHRLFTAETASALLGFAPRRFALSDGHVRFVKMGIMDVETLDEDKQLAEILLDAAAAAGGHEATSPSTA